MPLARMKTAGFRQATTTLPAQKGLPSALRYPLLLAGDGRSRYEAAVPLEYATVRRDDQPRSRLEAVALGVSVPFVLLFTLYAFGTFVRAAVMEPFYRHADWPHFFGYVIFPTAALVLCAAWALAVTALVWRRLLRQRWILLVLWSALASLVLAGGMHRYLIDVIEMGSWSTAPP
jgi:hypothetical protein